MEKEGGREQKMKNEERRSKGRKGRPDLNKRNWKQNERES
jgi:hypothetical protein